MSGYTKGPWLVGANASIYDKNGKLIPMNSSDVIRLVACVNACEGITTEGLEFAYNKNINPLPNMVTREQLENKIKELQWNVFALQTEVDELSCEVQEAYSRND